MELSGTWSGCPSQAGMPAPCDHPDGRLCVYTHAAAEPRGLCTLMPVSVWGCVHTCPHEDLGACPCMWVSASMQVFLWMLVPEQLFTQVWVTVVNGSLFTIC